MTCELNFKMKENLATSNRWTKVIYYGIIVFIGWLLFNGLSRTTPTDVMEVNFVNVINVIPQATRQNKIAMIVPFVGELPNYADIFIKSVAEQPIDVYFVDIDDRDILRKYKKYPSIKEIKLPRDFYSYAVDQMCELYKCTTLEKTTMRYYMQKSIMTTSKFLCQFRPMFSYIFRDYLVGYDYTGWIDIDTAFSNADLLSNLLHYNFDIITLSMGDMYRLYLRGQFTLFKNTLDLQTSFVKALPLPFLLASLENEQLITEEAPYSQYMLTTNYTIFIAPMQVAGWDCIDNITLRNGTLECLNFESTLVTPPTLELIATSTRQVPELTGNDCDINYMPLKYRSCFKNIENSFAVLQNQQAQIYELNAIAYNNLRRFPLFIHLQLAKYKPEKLKKLRKVFSLQ